MRALLLSSLLPLFCSACSVLAVADAAVSVAATTVKVAATVVGTTVDVATTVVGTTVDVAAAGVKAVAGSADADGKK